VPLDEYIRNVGVSRPALAINHQPGAASQGNPAFAIENDDSAAPALRIRSAGTLIDLQDSNGVSKYKVDSAGVVSSPGGQSPITSGFTSFATGGLPAALNSTSGANTLGVAGATFYAALVIPFNVLLTGVTFTAGSVGGTDLWIGALFGAAGNLIANSSLSGIAAPSSNTKKQFPFTAQVPVVGPTVYYIGLQTNGTTARFLGFPNLVEGFVTGQVNGSFGTLPSPLVPGTTFSQNVGPMASTY
jgi:hypothetical protein